MAVTLRGSITIDDGVTVYARNGADVTRTFPEPSSGVPAAVAGVTAHQFRHSYATPLNLRDIRNERHTTCSTDFCLSRRSPPHASSVVVQMQSALRFCSAP
jgi:hypothetical protein